MKTFAQLFAGNDECYTEIKYVPGTNQAGHKLEQTGFNFVHEPLQPYHYDEHVSGRRSIGVIPIMDGDVVEFVVLDVDDYDPENAEELICNVWRTTDNKWIPTLSKSGGVHLWAFFESPVPAEYAIEIARTWTNRFGIKAEIFPKQAQLRGDQSGNAINLPYFGEHRKAIDVDGEPIDLEEFVEMANDRFIPAPRREKPKSKRQRKKDAVPMHERGPPCIQAIIENGPIEDFRDVKLYQMAVFAMKYSQTDATMAQQMLGDMNRQHMSPPLDGDAVANKIRQMTKGPYGYQCEADWVEDVCDKFECKKREFGINSRDGFAGFSDTEAEIEEIIELYGNTGAPQYKVKIYGQHVFFESIEEMTTRDAFINRVLLATNKDLTWAGRADKFAPFIRKQLVEKRVVDERSHNEFVTLKGIVLNKFKSYVRDRVREDHANAADDEGSIRFENGVLWVPMGKILEQMDRIRAQLDQKIHRKHIDTILFDFGCEMQSHPEDGNVYYVHKGPFWFNVEDIRAKNQRPV